MKLLIPVLWLLVSCSPWSGRGGEEYMPMIDESAPRCDRISVQASLTGRHNGDEEAPERLGEIAFAPSGHVCECSTLDPKRSLHTGMDCESGCIRYRGGNACEAETLTVSTEPGVRFLGWVEPLTCAEQDPPASCTLERTVQPGYDSGIQVKGVWASGQDGVLWQRALGKAQRHALSSSPQGHITLLSGGYYPSEVAGVKAPDYTGLLLSLADDGSVRWHQPIVPRAVEGAEKPPVFWPRAVVHDAAGDIVVVGVASGDVTWGEPSGLPENAMRIVVMKLSDEGTWQWTRYLHQPELSAVQHITLAMGGAADRATLAVAATVGVRLGAPDETEKTSYQGWLVALNGDGTLRWQQDFVHDFPLEATVKLGDAFVDVQGHVHLVRGFSRQHGPGYFNDWADLVKEKRAGDTGALLDTRFMSRAEHVARPLLAGGPDGSWAYFGPRGDAGDTTLVAFDAAGEERWARPLEGYQASWLRVEPETRDLLLAWGGGVLQVWRFDSKGARLWTERAPLMHAWDVTLSSEGGVLAVGRDLGDTSDHLVRLKR